GSRRVRSAQVEEHGDDSLMIRGTVAGTRSAPYRVEIRVEGRSVRGSCDCPVGRNCKHAVAVVQEVRSAHSLRPVQMPPAWQRQLDQVLAPLERDEPAAVSRKRLALQVELPFP